MTVNPIALVVAGSVLAAMGQVFLKLGAHGGSRIVDFVNLRVFLGLFLYAVGSALWIAALAKLPLSKVYPFTILTFLLVYVASFAILGEPMRTPIVIGGALVIAGLVVIASA